MERGWSGRGATFVRLRTQPHQVMKMMRTSERLVVLIDNIMGSFWRCGGAQKCDFQEQKYFCDATNLGRNQIVSCCSHKLRKMCHSDMGNRTGGLFSTDKEGRG